MCTPFGSFIPQRTRPFRGGDPCGEGGVIHIKYDHKAVLLSISAAVWVEKRAPAQCDDGGGDAFEGLALNLTKACLAFRSENLGDTPPLATDNFLVQIDTHASPITGKTAGDGGLSARGGTIDVQCFHISYLFRHGLAKIRANAPDCGKATSHYLAKN